MQYKRTDVQRSETRLRFDKMESMGVSTEKREYTFDYQSLPSRG